MVTVREIWVATARRLRRTARRDWFLLFFGLLFLAFFLTLLIQPSAVGRGGR